ncbi:HNH endonuclease [Jatrophihabitans sp. GAS493]|uniref:HNH endonuclease n=1 Tax=Jatrophihabitans sp. GAS493 TaxID=1907575 RepID=UPI0018D56F1B|nr:HNH endonuclease [Jatrophihabitans sp. GAS493]
MRAGDDLFIWRAKVGLLAYCRALADAERVQLDTHVPWPDKSKYRYVMPIQILSDRWSAGPVISRWTELDTLGQIGGVPASQFPPVAEDCLHSIRQLFGEPPGPESWDRSYPSDISLDLAEMAVDHRVASIGALRTRQGQDKFRAALLTAYGRRCAITGTNTEEVLEAAHISAYRGPHTNLVANGLLLRADIHTLFDLNRLTVLPGGRVRVDPAIGASSEYWELDSRSIRVPVDPRDQPDVGLLRSHNATCEWLPALSV